MQRPVVSVVIGTYNRLDFLQMTIETVRAELEKLSGEIIVVDGGSDDGTTAWLVEQKDIITIVQHNRGSWRDRPITRKSWGYFMNLGFKAAQGRYICMLSDDCLVVPGAIKNGVLSFDSLPQTRKVGAMAFYWRNWPEQKTYWVGLTFGDKLFVNHGLYLNTALHDIGYADEDDYFFYHADGDICLRLAEAGYETVASESSYIEHRSDANVVVRSSNLERQQKDWKTYEAQWSKLGKPKKDWVEKSFLDPTGTAERFWKIEDTKKGFLRRLRK
jgi:glycosyltransferase involved in cell wall biosynthesis